ncbi:hypothetical protein ID866_5877 [Astraeus odoratus]|nr:hypothetical protein ID866_5877 [Astraeus odoratus]
MPGLIADAIADGLAREYSLPVDTVDLSLLPAAPNSGIKLGDYGCFDFRGFKRQGNVFEDMKAVRSDSRENGESTLDPTKYKIRTKDNADIDVKNDSLKILGKVVVLSDGPDHLEGLVLRQPESISLPNNQMVTSCLNSLSARLPGFCIVATAIRCKECYIAYGPEETVRTTWPESHYSSKNWKNGK